MTYIPRAEMFLWTSVTRLDTFNQFWATLGSTWQFFVAEEAQIFRCKIAEILATNKTIILAKSGNCKY